ncbi:MAG: S8/S53 family peptidase [Pseudomonadota bacterium]
MAPLLIILLSFPVQAQDLWKIYRKNEKVLMILETKKVWEERKFSDYKLSFISRLKLVQNYTMEPMFPGAPSKSDAEKIYGFQPRYDLRNFYILGISPDEVILKVYKSPFDFAESLRRASLGWGDLAIESVEPDLPLFAYPEITSLVSSDCPDKKHSPIDRAWSLRNMRILQAWQYSEKRGFPSKGFGEKVGHPDTGYSDHIDLDDKALKKDKKNNFIEKDKLPKDPLEQSRTKLKQPGHGTATGSVIISRGDVTGSPPGNEEGGTTNPGKVTGVACEADLVPYRAIESVVRLTYGNIEKAIYKAVQDGCSIVSLSLGGLDHRALNAVMEHAIGNNVIVVAAAGNFTDGYVVYPARYPFCIGVAATNYQDKPWKGSAYGERVAVSAPGEAVWRALRSKPNESTEEVEPSCGTSYSTANVAGIAALWLAHHKRNELIKKFDNDTKLQFIFKNLLKQTARCPAGWDKKKYGAGIVDAEKLLKTNPEKVLKQAKEDYNEFSKTKKDSAETNLIENQKMYYHIWGLR